MIYYTGWDVRGTIISGGQEVEVSESNFPAHTIGQLKAELLKQHHGQRWKEEPYTEPLGANSATQAELEYRGLEYLLGVPSDLAEYRLPAARLMLRKLS